ncbi:MAG: FAD-dependent oxidoreductase, partial [Candidatus Aminicenantales bacterium]
MSGEAVDIQIDGKAVRARAGESLLSAALKADIYIPHLCDHPALPPFDKVSPSDVCYRGGEAFRSGSNQEEGEGCGLCWVELKPGRKLVLSCTTPVEEGMDILTDTPELAARRRDHLARILRTHPHACLTCAQREGCSLTQCSTNVPEEERCCPQFDVCELRRVAEYVGIREDLPRYVPRNLSVEEDQPLFLRDYNLCVGCLRCVRACTEVVGAEALAYVIREREVVVGTRAPSIEESGCRYCGVCIEVCPTGALRDKDGKPAERKDALVPCVAECPLRMDVPSYVRLIREDRPAEAAAVIREKTPLAMTLGHICARPCETVCRRKEINDPVAICSLKRYALEASGLPPDVPKPASTGKKVAVVGGGPAGLVAAYFLALKGHAVTVFEGQDEPGGMLRWAVPEYRLPLHILRKEMEAIQD